MKNKFPALKRLVLASHNLGKLAEVEDLFRHYTVTLTNSRDLSLPEPKETGTSFAENASIKARATAIAARLPALADDSGLEINALNGLPGIFSARWAGPNKDFSGVAIPRIEREMAGISDRRARFVTALCLAWPNGIEIAVEGSVDGRLMFPGRGSYGFGYDPIFQPLGYDRTFGEMLPAEKQSISHRKIAFTNLVDQLFASC